MSRFYVKQGPRLHTVLLVHLPSNEAMLTLTESELKEVHKEMGEYIKSLPTPHPHAELMRQYSEDAATRQDPWVLWEYKNGTGWHEPYTHPAWHPNSKYRRKEIK